MAVGWASPVLSTLVPASRKGLNGLSPRCHRSMGRAVGFGERAHVLASQSASTKCKDHLRNRAEYRQVPSLPLRAIPTLYTQERELYGGAQQRSIGHSSQEGVRG